MSENDAMDRERVDANRRRAAEIKPDVDAFHLDMAGIGARIRGIREEQLGVTQAFFAKMLGFTGENTKSTVYKWETGQTLPDVDILYRIAMFGRMSIDALITGEENFSPLIDALQELIFEMIGGGKCTAEKENAGKIRLKKDVASLVRGGVPVRSLLPMRHPYSTMLPPPDSWKHSGESSQALYLGMCASGREMEKKRGKTRGKTAPPAK